MRFNHNDSGAALMNDLGAGAVPDGASYMGGFAYDPQTGAMHVTTASVSDDMIRNDGVATRNDGAMYVTNTAPAAAAHRLAGIAVDADGALHITTSAGESFLGGNSLTANGRLFVSI